MTTDPPPEKVTVTRDTLALALCTWHHAPSPNHPKPCAQSRTEADAVMTFASGRLR